MTAAMKFVILILLVGFVEAGIHKIPLIWRESKRIQMIKEGTWENYIKEKESLQYDNRTQKPVSFMANLADFLDLEYVANVTFGYYDTIQTFQVLLDTGSSDLWIPDISCDNCQSKNRYNLTKASEIETWKIEYGDGSSASGFLDYNLVSFDGANLNNINTTFGRATHADADSPYYDGILGLAFKSSSNFHIDGKTSSPFLYNALEQKVIDKLMFTVYLQRRPLQNGVPGGYVTFGATDTENCSPNVEYHKLTTAKWFEFSINSVSIDNYNSSVGWQAISDTGDAMIRGPKEIVDNITDAVNATFNLSHNLFNINCSATFDDLKFKIGGLEYSVPSENLKIEIENGNCFFGMTYQTTENNEWIFGVPWIRSFCNVYNLQDETIGFAKLRH